MNKYLTYINALGIFILAGLCGIQWRTNGNLGILLDNSEMVREQQAGKIDEQSKSLTERETDAEALRGQLSLSHARLKSDDEKLGTAIQENASIASQRDRLKARLNEWMTAVSDRDMVIKKAS